MENIKRNYRPHLTFLGIVIAIIGISTFVYAQVYGGGSIAITNSNVSIDNKSSGQSLGSDEVFSSFNPTNTSNTVPELLAGFNQINVAGGIRQGDNNTFTAEGRTFYLAVVDFTDATTTPVDWVNPYDETIYVTNMWIDLLGKGTTTVRMAVSTSSSQYINPTTVTYLDGDNGSNAKLMKTFGTLGQGSAHATGTKLFWNRYPSTGHWNPQTQDEMNLADNERIQVFATSTNASAASDNDCSVVCAANTFDGELYIEYYVID